MCLLVLNSKWESDINTSNNLSYNNDPRNIGEDGSSIRSLGLSGGPTESSGTNNSSNRSVIDFVIEIEYCTSIFDYWEFFDIM
jgi:hypothetical protein